MLEKKENSENTEQKVSPEVELATGLVKELDIMQKYAFYIGLQRGIMMCINTTMLKYIGKSFAEYEKLKVKPQIHAVAPVTTIITIMVNILRETEIIASMARQNAEKAANEEVTPEEPKKEVLV